MRVLLVEDEPDLGTAIRWALKQEKYIVDWAQDGNEAWEYLQNQGTQYTIALVDWMLPGITGIELCQRLRQRHNPLPVLLLTAKDRLQDKIMGLDAGADDYLVKPFEMEELLARMRALQRRSPAIPVQQLQIGQILLNYTDRTVYYQQPDGRLEPILLTNKEFQLLEYFMNHPHQIVTKDQLLSRIWEMDAEVGSNVVAAQIRLLRRKLTEKGCVDFIETLPSMGYRLHPDYAK
ncbi:two-component system response regulator RppA [Leptolyngbya sp. GB1-A1]|uniref:two-component system response regulator RppA n=1 Tax=unclassified Leptolyngbya TaxID=2650499 RepID=UPI0019BE3DF5|nr:response regulator transcription factor [Cyanobacteria bacterium FACHB-502]